MRLAMTLLVRDGADILEDNLRYHRALGVDLFVVGDNGSTDGSLEMLERYERAGLIALERIGGQAREAQGEGRTRLARLARSSAPTGCFTTTRTSSGGRSAATSSRRWPTSRSASDSCSRRGASSWAGPVTATSPTG